MTALDPKYRGTPNVPGLDRMEMHCVLPPEYDLCPFVESSCVLRTHFVLVLPRCGFFTDQPGRQQRVQSLGR